MRQTVGEKVLSWVGVLLIANQLLKKLKSYLLAPKAGGLSADLFVKQRDHEGKPSTDITRNTPSVVCLLYTT